LDSAERTALELFLRRLTSRSILTKEEEGAVLGLTGQVLEIRAHRDLIHVGQQVSHCCLVMDGLVGRFGQNSDGVRQISGIYIPGDMPDLASLVSPKAGWGMGTLAKTTLLRVPHADIRRIAAAHPGVAEAFWRDSVADGSMFSEWVVNVGRRSAATRLAHVFCELAVRWEQSGLADRNSYPLPITQADLADATGLTAVHANRSLRSLRTLCGVTARDGRVTIPDWRLLVSAGDFDDAYMLLHGPAPRIGDLTN
jgi:CRP-like cAMP-binding protein